MAKFDNPLNNLKVASPCSQDWDAMIGNDRTRYCGECKLNVFNLSGMSRTEAENLIMNAEGRLCVRFYKRADGSVITADCPVGWARVKQRTRAYVTAVASLIFTFFGAIGLVAAFKKSNNTIVGSIAVSTPTPKNTPKTIMGDVSMGTPVPTPENYTVTTGMVRPNKDEATVGKIQIRRNVEK
ncbi:MAG TPA: hypothetical protein VNB22_24845 [Pyrinomonadaceae bacterium]|jgi:hypothetical protein|nr:hypothetical protein [Pyrinomonadaceae bacterium]